MKQEAKYEKIEEKLLETRSFTPVTKENFEAFFKEFYAKNHKKDKLQLEQESRITGREFFMNLKNKNILDNQQDEDEENIPTEEKVENKNEKTDQMYYDENAFDENLDDLNFDDNEENEIDDN